MLSQLAHCYKSLSLVNQEWSQGSREKKNLTILVIKYIFADVVAKNGHFLSRLRRISRMSGT